MKAKFTPIVACAAALSFAFCGAGLAVPEGWTTDLEAAKKQASETKRDIFMNFTGSDW